jgi:hypothetical protein
MTNLTCGTGPGRMDRVVEEDRDGDDKEANPSDRIHTPPSQTEPSASGQAPPLGHKLDSPGTGVIRPSGIGKIRRSRPKELGFSVARPASRSSDLSVRGDSGLGGALRLTVPSVCHGVGHWTPAVRPTTRETAETPRRSGTRELGARLGRISALSGPPTAVPAPSLAPCEESHRLQRETRPEGCCPGPAGCLVCCDGHAERHRAVPSAPPGYGGPRRRLTGQAAARSRRRHAKSGVCGRFSRIVPLAGLRRDAAGGVGKHGRRPIPRDVRTDAAPAGGRRLFGGVSSSHRDAGAPRPAAAPAVRGSGEAHLGTFVRTFRP